MVTKELDRFYARLTKLRKEVEVYSTNLARKRRILKSKQFLKISFQVMVEEDLPKSVEPKDSWDVLFSLPLTPSSKRHLEQLRSGHGFVLSCALPNWTGIINSVFKKNGLECRLGTKFGYWSPSGERQFPGESEKWLFEKCYRVSIYGLETIKIGN